MLQPGDEKKVPLRYSLGQRTGARLDLSGTENKSSSSTLEDHAPTHKSLPRGSPMPPHGSFPPTRLTHAMPTHPRHASFTHM